MFRNFLNSAQKLKDLRVMCASALLAALYVAVYALKIPINDSLRITFTFLPVALAGWLFGIVPSMLVGFVGDIVGCFAFPSGAYFPGYTLTAILTGLIFGIFLYEKNAKNILLPIIISKLLVTVLLNIGLNSCWASFFVDKAVILIMSGKIVKNIAMLPVEIALLYGVIIALDKAGIRKMYK